MGRKKKSTAGEDIVELVALMPWWAGVAAAFASYLLMRHLAQGSPSPVAVGASQIGPAISSAIIVSLAKAGQYLLPLLCLAGSGLSWYRRRTRHALLEQAADRTAVAPFADLTWQQFEQLVGEAYRRDGFEVEETGGGGADGGVDLVLRRDGERHLVQCKQWRAWKVGVATVRELYGVMAAKGAASGSVVTSGRFTDEAKAFANGRNIRLVDGALLKKIIDRSGAARP